MTRRGKGLIPISAARALSEKHKAPVVVIFAIHPDRENFTVTTYGATKKLCRLAAQYGDGIFSSMHAVAKLVQVEDATKPEYPAQWVGREP